MTRCPGRALAGRRLHPLPWTLPVPLRVHGHYSRAEIEAAFGVLSDDAPWIHREGVLWHEPSQCDLLFITLRKSEALFSPTTRYRDLALGPTLFHWESQSTTTTASSTGQRYLHHAARGSRVLPPNRSCAWGLPPMRAMRVNAPWRSAGGWSGRSRRPGCRPWPFAPLGCCLMRQRLGELRSDSADRREAWLPLLSD
jgi:hypothetical protein